MGLDKAEEKFSDMEGHKHPKWGLEKQINNIRCH